MAEESTTLYRWNEGIIRAIEVRTQANGWAVAYIEADNDPSQRELRNNIRAALRLKGWGTLSDSRDGKFVLRVAGLRSGDELVAMLRNQGFVKTEPQISTVPDEAEQKTGLWAKIRARSLRASGIFATIGNAMSITQGVLRSRDMGKIDVGQIGMGAAFAVADLPLVLVDEKDNARQLNLLLKKLRAHYERDGIEIPKSASIYVETSGEGKSFAERAQDFIHEYANQIKCGFEVVASYFSIKAGINQGNKGKIIAGSIFGPGFFASLVIPEKKIDLEQYAVAGPLKRLWMNIQSNPLSVGGLLGYANTIFTYKSGFDERRRYLYPDTYPTLPNPKTGELKLPTKHYKWDLAIPTDMIAANGLYAISKKTVGGDIKSEAMVRDAYRIAAQIINKQPGVMRERAMESTARFFAERMEIKEHYAQARERLIAELDSQRANPWFEHQGLPPYRAAAQAQVAADIRSKQPAEPLTPAEATAPSNVIALDSVQHEDRTATLERTPG